MDELAKIKTLFEQSLPLFNALGDPIRQQLILLMIDGQRRSVAELTAFTALSRPTISHHLKVLKDAHIITSERDGTKTYYRPQLGAYFHPIKELVNVVEKVEHQKGKRG